MGSVVEKKKKTLLDRLLSKVKPGSQQETMDLAVSDFESGDIDLEEIALIESRREMLRAEKHNNSDAVVTHNTNEEGS